MTTGTVKLFSRLKRYGFIRSNADGRDVFVSSFGSEAGDLANLRKSETII